jgi:excisionase family DNA binding protein
MPKSSGRLTSIANAASILEVTPRTVRRYIARGDLAAYRLGSTTTVRVSLDDVDKLLRPIPAAGGDAA